MRIAVPAPAAQPFLKWAGGKRQLLPQLLPLLPKEWNRYWEPFVGGAAMFLALQPRDAVLGDANDELVTCYRVVRDQLPALLEQLDTHRDTEEHFLHVRAQDTSSLSDVERAARTIYLNRTCFNGLYRVNRHGQFNTPYGRYGHDDYVPRAALSAASVALQGVELRTGDFTEVLAGAGEGDLVYLDPPYVPRSEYSDFRRYSRVQFRDADHERLALTFKELDARGCRVVLSNSDVPLVRQLFADWRLHEVSARRSINAQSAGRGPVTELVVTNA